MSNISIRDKLVAVRMYEEEGHTLQHIADAFHTSVALVHYWKTNKNRLLKKLEINSNDISYKRVAKSTQRTHNKSNNSKYNFKESQKTCQKNDDNAPNEITDSTKYMKLQVKRHIDDNDITDNVKRIRIEPPPTNIPITFLNPNRNIINSEINMNTNLAQLKTTKIDTNGENKKTIPITFLNINKNCPVNVSKLEIPLKSNNVVKVDPTIILKDLDESKQFLLSEYQSLKNLYDMQKIKMNYLMNENNDEFNDGTWSFENDGMTWCCFTNVVNRLEYLEKTLLSYNE